MLKFKTAAMSVGVAVAGALVAPGVHAIDLTSGDWKFSVNGNVNVHYIYSSCEHPDTAAAIVTVGGACTGSATGSSVSNVGNGLLPAALTFGISTTQMGWDIAAHFGLYPGINSNDGGSPNLQQNAGSGGNSNVALATTGLDVRQVYLTFGNANVGTFTFGRNFGLFGFDAIINDMTIPGVGVAGSMSSANPANTSLGSIGFGYIYTDTYAQMNYTTPKFAGFDATIGIFDPLNELTANGTNQAKKAPGIHGKVTYTMPVSDITKLYFSGTFIHQRQDYVTGGGVPIQFSSTGGDVLAKVDVGPFEAVASYYYGLGMGTTGLYIFADDGTGHARKSNGYLLQATYAMGPVKYGVNYGYSRLETTNFDTVPNLLNRNRKVTGGVYYSLVKNLTLLGEVSRVWTDAHDGGENKSINGNVGAFLSF